MYIAFKGNKMRFAEKGFLKYEIRLEYKPFRYDL